MVGRRVLKALAGIIIPFLSFFLMSQNTFALVPSSISSSLTIRRSTTHPDWSNVVEDHNHALPVQLLSYEGQTLQVRQLNVSSSVSPTQTGQYFSGNFTLKLLWDWQDQGYPSSAWISCKNITQVEIRPEQGTVVSSDFAIQSCNSTYVIYAGQTGPQALLMTIKVNGSGKLSASTTVSSYVIRIVSTEQAPFFTGNLTAPNSWGMSIPNGGLDINFNVSQDPTTTAIGGLENTIQEQYNKENEAINNIENQSANDISDSSNAATTNLIGVITGFIDQLTGFSASPNCNLSLPFPSFIGGSQTVNICTGKEVFTRSNTSYFLSGVSNLTALCFFIPLAFTLLKMIYNEIRSFTNG